MLPRIIKLFKGDRKYFTIVFFVLLLIIISAVITPVIISSIENNWKNGLNKEINSFENTIISEFRESEKTLLAGSSGLKSDLRKVLIPGGSYGSIIEILNKGYYDNFSVEVYAPNGRLIGWNKNSPVTRELPFPLKAPLSEVHFTDSGLLTWLSVIDTIDFDTDHFYLISHLPFSKHYRLQNNYYKEIDFEKRISEKLMTPVSISFSQPVKNNDGRYYSFNLLNLQGSRIAEVSFLKPLLDTSLNAVRDINSIVQALLFAAAYFFLFLALRNDYKQITSRFLKFLILAGYLSGFRVLLYFLKIPSRFLNGAVDDPSYFASSFAWGIVKSPAEFLITNIFVLLIVSSLFFQFRHFTINHRIKPFWYFIAVLPAAILFLMTARGLNAAVRSIIFDSSLRYFKDPEIIPGLPGTVMILNLLLLGISVITVLLSLLMLLNSLRKNDYNKFYWISFIIFQAAGFLFVILQPHPLISPLMQFVFISLIFLTQWFISKNIYSGYNFVYIALAASVISISLLNYFNQHLERESLKTTAFELNRPDENLLSFLIRETLKNGAMDENITSGILKKESNFTALAFAVWSKSPLQGESLNSSVSVLDKNKNLLGEFRIGMDEESPTGYFENYSGSDIQIAEITIDAYRKVFKGIKPVLSDEKISGYLTASVVLDLRNPAGTDYPEFLVSQKNFFNSVVDASQIKIFEILNSKLTYVFGDIYPSREQIKPVINAEFQDNESWQVLDLNNERFIAYALKNIVDGNEKITVVLYRDNRITWNLFNFFKIFFLHAIFILICFLIIFVMNIRTFRYTFRMQLLTAFLLISIIPVIILAAFIRQTVNERSNNAISYELNERLEYIENHVRNQMLKHKDRDFNDAFDNAAAELGISFNVYENTNQTFSSRKQYYSSGFFNAKLNPVAHYQLNYLSFREYLTEQEIENFSYNAFYKKLNINGKDFILGVNDAFNKVRLSFTSTDADILLFGVYSFAVIIIILINTVLANRISAPIRQLTKATSAVAQGDLNVKVVNKEKGEMRDLIDGFNLMTGELRKNEADIAQLERETAWKEMAKQVAHEIKNPLTPMKLAVQQMVISFKENKNFEKIFTRVTETLLNQIENLNQIASEFSRFARMPHFDLERVDVADILKDTVNLFADENVNLRIVNETREAVVEADKSHFRRLFINMIRNSIQAGAGKITITLKGFGGGYEIFIKDNGTGIPAEFQDRLFEPDFTTKEKGTGVGLKLAKRFIEGIKGDISLINSSENGTEFRIYIPAVQ